MITNEQIKQCIADCKKAGHTIGLRDISYVMLCKHYDDYALAYKCLFGLDVDYNAEYVHTYNQTASIEYLKLYVAENFKEVTKRNKKGYDDISFDENKAYMLKLKKDTEDAIANGEIEKKDGLKILADLSVKLNDKFDVKDFSKDQLIFVNNKFADVCPTCGHETPMPSKERCMREYNLIEKE